MTSLGSVTSLGVGSGFDLQQMLVDFRKIDEAPIDTMRGNLTDIKEQIPKYDEVNAKLIEIKTHALSLSLGSNFIERSVSVSDEEVATATTLAGAAATSNSIEVTRTATKSSWQTNGVASSDTIAYVPTIQELTTGFDNTDLAEAVSAAGTLAISYGAGIPINVDLTEGMTLDQVTDAINNDSENDNGEDGTYITASTFAGEDGKYYLRMASTEPGSSEATRVTITNSPEGFEFGPPNVTFTYALGDSAPVAVSVSADATFAELATVINEDENTAGITASVINDGTSENPYRLVITSDNTGEDNRLTITGIQMTEVQGAEGASLNAEVKVDGITYERQSNEDIDDIIQGVTLSLQNEGTATISVSSDTEIVKTEITGLVEAYNDIIGYIKAETAYDNETEEWGALNEAYAIKGLPNQLNAIISSIIDTLGGEISSMYDLGMEINRDGSITIDEEILDQALVSNLEDIAAFFVTDDDTGRKGFADILNDSLRDMTASNGFVANEKNYAEDRIDRLEEDIEAGTERLDKRYEILTRQFIELDRYIGVMNSQSDYLTQMIDSFNNTEKS